MFTGIIQGTGTVTGLKPVSNGLKLLIKASFLLDQPQLGESIAVNGVCLTATEISESIFSADVSPETLSRTNLGETKPGSIVNLERALRLSDRLGGHIVSGHIDCTGKLLEKKPFGQFTVYSYAIPKEFDKYLVEKGSVAIDGISLTVNSCGNGVFSVSIIPHTAAATTLPLLHNDSKVNIEFDIIGKYIERLVSKQEKTASTRIDSNFLAQHGFI